MVRRPALGLPLGSPLFPVLLLSLACGSGSGTGPDPAVTSVTISPTPVTLVVGGSWPLVARDQAGRPLTGSGVSWTTSAPAVATVSASGIVLGVGDGPVTITATVQGKAGSAAVTVVSLSLASVAAGGAHSCALTTNGAAFCWGRNEVGQLGVALPPASCTIDAQVFPCSVFPVAVQGGLSFTTLDAGSTHTCGLTATGSAYCWGRNNAGQLGDNSATNRSAPVAVAGGLTFTRISVDALHSCGLIADGTAYCWGANSAGQLGDGTTTNRSAPVAVNGGLSFATITTGGYGFGLTCARTAAGVAYCWGENGAGQLGIGASDALTHPIPEPVSGGIAFASLAAGPSHVCGLTAAGSAYCWGENVLGSLGDGSEIERPAPVAVAGGIAFTGIVVGGFSNLNAHTCGLTGTGQAYCWGDNEVGALGDGTLVQRLAPAAVTGQLSFASLEAGYRHSCGRTGAGVVYCWGSNRAGQLGINSVAQESEPTLVIGQQ